MLVLTLEIEGSLSWKRNTELQKSDTCVQQDWGDDKPYLFISDDIFGICQSFDNVDAAGSISRLFSRINAVDDFARC